ncbi:MAG: cation-translocating P-type ATPase, partial [Bacillota bacterium]
LFVNQFKSFVMLLLTSAAVASFLIGEVVEGIAVLVVILITAFVGLIMEYRAGKSIEALKQTIKDEVTVLRDGKKQPCLTEDIVKGDIVILDEGDKVPADGRLITNQGLSVDESMLTGESDMVEKTTDTLEEDAKLADQKNMVFMGSHVVKGDATYVVTATALDTEMGHISSLLKDTKDEDTPLEKRLEQTGRFLIVLTLIIAAIVGLVGILTGNSIESMVKTSVALAIAAVPEGLPAAATITLAIGMKRMAKKQALLRNLPAVETLGSATIFCTDKTGTITENEMTVKQLVTLEKTVNIKGTGYTPKGEFKTKDKTIDPTKDKVLKQMLEVGVLCNEATLKQDEDNNYTVIGDPTEGALLVAAKKAGMTKDSLEDKYTYVDSIPFDSERQYMAVLYKTDDNTHLIAIKGSPDVILSLTSHAVKKGETKLTKNLTKKLKKTNTRLAKERYRVLALAYKTIKNPGDKALETLLEDQVVFLGFTAMLDPSRPDIKDSINQAKQAGIRTIMLTGDQYQTAIGIAKKVGLDADEDKLLEQSKKHDLSKDDIKSILSHSSVFARVTPEDKLTIVESLQDDNEIVAMTGDGVNDAPALKKADIGIAMGKRGTSVAKEAADMILLDDRYQTIVEAVKQGRVIFDNIQKFIHYLLSCNLSEIILIFLALLLGFPLPLVALQILWLNVATGVFPALSMSWEVPEKGVMDHPPRTPGSPIITSRYKQLIGFQGFMLALGPLVVYAFLITQNTDVMVARTVAFMTLAMVHLFHIINVRKKTGLGVDTSIFQNPYMLGAIALTFTLQMLAIYASPLQSVLETVALPLNMWQYIIIGALLPILAIQAFNIIVSAYKTRK